MTGKEKCNLLRQIRREIAEANDIPYLSAECNYIGDDCPGTCPKCDAEIQALDMLLNQKAARGEKITVAGISLDTYRQSVPFGVFQDKRPVTPDWNDFLHTAGIMVPQDDKLQLPLNKLNLPEPMEQWLMGENISTVGKLYDLLRSNPEKLHYHNAEWYHIALAELEQIGLWVLDTVDLMGDVHAETGLIDFWTGDDAQIL